MFKRMTNVHPSDETLTLWRDMTRLCRAGYGLRFRYVRLIVVHVAMQAFPATVCVSCRKDAHYTSSTHKMGVHGKDNMPLRYSNDRNRCPECQDLGLSPYA
jgi:hypothetical protein